MTIDAEVIYQTGWNDQTLRFLDLGGNHNGTGSAFGDGTASV